MYKYGFELEGFYRNPKGDVALPPKGYPTDGFPGLCEVRSTGGKDIWEAYTELLGQYAQYPFDHQTISHFFTPDERRQIRARHGEKSAVSIENVYGKKPKALGNRTLASLQVNISYQICGSYHDDKGVYHPATYGLFDYLPIIKKLDAAFKDQIEDAGRQIGWYSIKDGCRVEYRSIPNLMFSIYPSRIQDLISRIKRCMEE